MTKFVGTLNIPSLASAPGTALEGDLYYNTTTDKVNFYNGTTWSAINQASGAMNYAQTQATKQSTISASGVTIVSTSITTNGYPVQVIVTGDAENNNAGAWVKLQLYRDSTAIGKIIHVEGSAASENIPYSLTVIDAPAAGTYTYSLKTASAVAGGTYNFGETDGPVLTAIELSGATTAGVTTLTGTANQITASASTGAVTLSLPQSIATSSTPSFSQITATGGDTTTSTDTASLNLSGYNQRGGTGYHGFLDVKNTYGSGTNPKKFFRLTSAGALEIINNAYSSTIFALTDAGALTVPSLTVNGTITGNKSGTTDVNQGIILQRTTTLSIAATSLSTTPTTANTTAITWSSAVKANTSMWSSGSAITAPLAGYYQINLNFQFGTGTSYAAAGYIFQGSTLIAHAENQAGANTAADMINVSTVIYCAANDSITARMAASTTSKSLIVTSQNGYFSMVYLGAQT